MPTTVRLIPMKQCEVDAAIEQSGYWVDLALDETTMTVLRSCKISDEVAHAIVLAVHQAVDEYRMQEHLRRNRLSPASMATQARTTAEFIRETTKRIQYMDPVVRAHAIGLGMSALGKTVIPDTTDLTSLAAVLSKVADRVEGFAKPGRPKKTSRNTLLNLTLEALNRHLPDERKAKRLEIAQMLFDAWHIELPQDDNKLRNSAALGRQTKTR